MALDVGYPNIWTLCHQRWTNSYPKMKRCYVWLTLCCTDFSFYAVILNPIIDSRLIQHGRTMLSCDDTLKIQPNEIAAIVAQINRLFRIECTCWGFQPGGSASAMIYDLQIFASLIGMFSLLVSLSRRSVPFKWLELAATRSNKGDILLDSLWRYAEESCRRCRGLNARC